jgi:hypothetical protein
MHPKSVGIIETMCVQ